MRTKYPTKHTSKKPEKKNASYQRRPAHFSHKTKSIPRITNPDDYYNMSKEELLLYLTHQQKIFCYEYIKDFKVYQAYRRAGYKSKKRSPASLLRAKPQVDAMIEALVEEKRKQIDIEVDQVLKELSYIGFSDIAEFCTWKNSSVRLLRSDQLTYEQTKAVSVVQETKYGIKLTMHNKMQAIRMIGEYLKMFSADENNDSKTPEEKAQEIKAALDALQSSVPTKATKENRA